MIEAIDKVEYLSGFTRLKTATSGYYSGCSLNVHFDREKGKYIVQDARGIFCQCDFEDLEVLLKAQAQAHDSFDPREGRYGWCARDIVHPNFSFNEYEERTLKAEKSVAYHPPTTSLRKPAKPAPLSAQQVEDSLKDLGLF